MFADIVKFINLSNEKPSIIFGGTIIKDEPICNDINKDKDIKNTKDIKDDDARTDFSNCIDNWVIKNN